MAVVVCSVAVESGATQLLSRRVEDGFYRIHDGVAHLACLSGTVDIRDLLSFS